MANKVDYNPNFERDPKETIGLYREQLLEKELATPKSMAEAQDHKEPVVPEIPYIKNRADFARTVDDLAKKLEAVNARADALTESLVFDPIPLPEEQWHNMDILGIVPNNEFTTGAANCTIHVMHYEVNKLAGLDLDDIAEEYDNTIKKWFPVWGIKLLLILFFMFLKGITWQLLSTFCRAFKKIRIKIIRWKICIGCPFAKLFRKLTMCLNRGRDYKIDNKGKPVLDKDGNIQKWGSCPPDFDPYGFDPETALINDFRGEDVRNPEVESICETDKAPSPLEKQAAESLLGAVISLTTKEPTENNLQASQYIVNKTQSDSFKKTVSNLLSKNAEANDPKGTIFKIDPISSANQGISKIQTDVEKAISDYNPQKLIDEASKGILQLVNGMLKVWDGMVSAINKTANISPVTKDLICCFLNILGVMFPNFSIDKKVSVEKIEGVLEIMITLIDMELDSTSAAYEAEYFTLNDMSSAIEDAILYVVYAIMSPIANDLLEDVKSRFDVETIINKYIKKIEGVDFDTAKDKLLSSVERPKIIESIQKCKLFDSFSKMLNVKIDEVQLSVQELFIGFKGQNDIKTRKLEGQIQLGSKLKLLFSLNTILKGVLDSFKKDVSFLVSICNEDGNVSPVDYQTIEQQLNPALYTNNDITIPDPVYNQSMTAGIEEGDPVDTVFTTGEFYDATYANMPGYSTQPNEYGTIETRDNALDLSGGMDHIDNTVDQMGDKPKDQNIRDCTDATFLKTLFVEAETLNNLDTLFNI